MGLVGQTAWDGARIRKRDRHDYLVLVDGALKRFPKSFKHFVDVSGDHGAHASRNDPQAARMEDLQGVVDGRRKVRLTQKIEADLCRDTRH